MSDTNTRYSYAVTTKESIELQFPVATTMGWDSFKRLVYQKNDKVIQADANKLLARGNVTMEEARELVEVKRNGLVLSMREELSPFGKFYSETLKPASSLPTLEQLIAKKGSIEAVLVSVGKSRASVDKLSYYCRRAGVAGLVLEIVSVSVVVAETPYGHKTERFVEEGIGLGVDMGVGSVGMWGGGMAGAAWAGTWASPTLLIPVVGEVTEGGAIIVGGIAGAILAGWTEHRIGAIQSAEHAAAQVATEAIWRLLPIQWH
jgi:hypothetical protein